MTSLDELFSEELSRQTTETTAEQRGVVADATVKRARRHRRVRAAVQGVGVAAAVGLAIGVGSLVMGDGDAQPVATPEPVPTAPVEAYEARESLPQAQAMDATDWDAVDGTWDIELASVRNAREAGAGSTVAVYLTPPGGERLLALADSDFKVDSPILLSFVPEEGSAVVYDDATGKLYELTLPDGAVTELQIRGDETLWGAHPLGKSSTGTSAYVLWTESDGPGATEDHVFVHAPGRAEELSTDGAAPSPVWGSHSVTNGLIGLSVLNVDTGESQPIPNTADCNFEVWNIDGTFTANCGIDPERSGDYVAIDPATGERTVLWASSDVASAAEASVDLTQYHAIDGTRAWVGRETSGLTLRPPMVVGTDGSQVDLWDGFTGAPSTYAVIFGIRD